MANILDHKFAESDFVGKGASSLPNRPREAGMDGTAVKAVLDNIAKVMIALGKHNDLIDNLLSTTDGNSGADSIGVTAIPGVTGATTQAVLESLKTLIDATVIDQIPDNSLAEIKMADEMKKDVEGGVASYEIVSTHEALKAAAAVLGHIKAGSGVSIDANGVLTSPVMKVGSFTRDTSIATGAQAITGVGFTPRLILLLAGVGGTSEMSIGFQNASASFCVATRDPLLANTWVLSSTISVYLIQGSGIEYWGYVASFNADGFTMGWTKNGATAGTSDIYYIAIK